MHLGEGGGKAVAVAPYAAAAAAAAAIALGLVPFLCLSVTRRGFGWWRHQSGAIDAIDAETKGSKSAQEDARASSPPPPPGEGGVSSGGGHPLSPPSSPSCHRALQNWESSLGKQGEEEGPGCDGKCIRKSSPALPFHRHKL